MNLQRLLFSEPAITLVTGPGLYSRVGLYVALEVSFGGKPGFAEMAAEGLLASVPPPVDHQVALAGEPLSAALALEGLGVLPAVTGEAGRREVRLAARLAQHKWHGSLCYLMCLFKGTPNIIHNLPPAQFVSVNNIFQKHWLLTLQELTFNFDFGNSCVQSLDLSFEKGNSMIGFSELPASFVIKLTS